MSNWVTLDSVVALANSRYSEWDVETQYRSTDEFLTISNWTSLDIINPLSEGLQDKWTEWRTVASIGDFTGRIFQFRLRLRSFKASVSPRVIDGVIRSDMADRQLRFDNIIVGPAGIQLTFMPAFMGPGLRPSIQVTQDAMQQGDYFVLSSRNLAGVYVNVYDKNDNPVSRQLDLLVSGYGRQHSVVI
jgi:hypothetical protein